tara:strand:+ start:3078 stop:3773 length:696 start_codon:yes stop_codon:yes gene_type:complete
MGYLDNSTVTVDAILTKQGRKKLAQNQPLNISYFTLVDTGTDYTTWNEDHPSGSAYYGEAIEALPNLEALPNSAHFMMRNNLVTYAKGTDRIPSLKEIVDIDFGDSMDSVTRTVEMTTGYATPSGFAVVVADTSIVLLNGSTGAPGSNNPMDGNLLQYLNTQDIQSAGMINLTANDNGLYNLTVAPQPNWDATKELTIIVISLDNGAYTSFKATVGVNTVEGSAGGTMGDY